MKVEDSEWENITHTWEEEKEKRTDGYLELEYENENENDKAPLKISEIDTSDDTNLIAESRLHQPQPHLSDSNFH